MLLINIASAIHPIASTVPIKADIGWTPAATIGVVQTFLGVAGGGVGLRLLANHLLTLQRIAQDRASKIDERSDAYTAKLSQRITELEGIAAAHAKELSDERRACDEKLEAMRAEMRDNDRKADEANRDMQHRMDGLVRQMVQFQASAARTLELPPEMQRSLDKLDEITGGQS